MLLFHADHTSFPFQSWHPWSRFSIQCHLSIKKNTTMPFAFHKALPSSMILQRRKAFILKLFSSTYIFPKRTFNRKFSSPMRLHDSSKVSLIVYKWTTLPYFITRDLVLILSFALLLDHITLDKAKQILTKIISIEFSHVIFFFIKDINQCFTGV